MRKSQFNKKLPEILQYFADNPRNVYSITDIYQVRHSKGWVDWKLPKSLSSTGLLNLLLKNNALKTMDIYFPKQQFQRFVYGKPNIWAYCISLIKNSYYTHRTALYIHGLINKDHNEIYLNFEQRRNSASNSTSLTQNRINFALSKPQRVSNNIADFEGYKIHLLNGQNTNRYGVIKTNFNGTEIYVTDLERTLIDIVVRSSYTGGIKEIFNCYKAAKGKISIEKLAETLKHLALVYPYHQCIGFLLEKTGNYDSVEIKKLKDFGLKYDFYLTREISEKEYSKEWKLYYPSNII